MTDYNPLRENVKKQQEVLEALPSHCGFYHVDAHNIVPVWVASDK